MSAFRLLEMSQGKDVGLFRKLIASERCEHVADVGNQLVQGEVTFSCAQSHAPNHAVNANKQQAVEVLMGEELAQTNEKLCFLEFVYM